MREWGVGPPSFHLLPTLHFPLPLSPLSGPLVASFRRTFSSVEHMHREHTRWFSPSLGRDMDLLVFGHGGARVLVFPTSMGRFYEWEDRGMIGTLGESLERGWLQLFCVDSVDADSWYARHRHPAERAQAHTRYDAYIEREVIPFTQHWNRNPFLIATGASFGAYHAVAFALRHPHLVGRVIGMSGMYDIRGMTEGYTDTDVHYANPRDL